MTPDVHAAPELLTGEQVAERLGLSRQRIQQLTGRPDFPQPVGRVGKAIVWRETDVDDYGRGVRQFFAINGYPISIDQARELAARLRREAAGHTATAAARVAQTIEGLEGGGTIAVTEDEALAVYAAIQKWLEDTNVDVVGEPLLTLRYALHGDLQDAGLLGPRDPALGAL